MNDSAQPTIATRHRWAGGRFATVDDCDIVDSRLEVADSFLVAEGRVLALELHRQRFAESAETRGFGDGAEIAAFWMSALALVPTTGSWFPRFELTRERDSLRLQFRLRSSPALQTRAALWTYRGPDPRHDPTIKGPDLEAMLRIRTSAHTAGASEAVLVDDGSIADGSTSAILWWRGSSLCLPPADLPRVASVTARSIVAIATAFGAVIEEEAAAPESVAGCEVWAVNALHGIRVCDRWIDGPALAEVPGRADAWRRRLDALRRPLSRV